MSSVEELKSKGNAALQNNNNEEAIRYYSEAIQLDSNNHILFSNRSAAFAKSGKYREALVDAEKTISLKKDWGKGYSRKGAALELLDRYDEAKTVYEEGLKYEANNAQLVESLNKVKDKLMSDAAGGAFKNPFSDPKFLANLAMNPNTRNLLSDPEVSKLLQDLQRNPNDLQKLLNHPKGSQLLGAMFGGGMAGAGGDDEMDTHEIPTPQPSKPAEKPKTESSAKKPAENAAKSNLTEEQKKAESEKELGNEAYKKKDFEAAHKHYDAAIALDPNCMAYLTNKAAVFFEQAEYEKCIETCEKAIEIGRENKADYAVIAKALARIGNSYHKLKDLEKAMKFYDRSLAEHRNDDVLKKKKAIEKEFKDQERLKYINPELAEQEKNLGNDAFKKGDFPLSIKHYSEAIKRNPNDAKLYRNRAASYTKLMEFPLAVKDCDEAIRLDPTFIKAYLQKGSTLQALKEPSQALIAYSKALEIDPNCQEAIEGYRVCSVDTNSNPEEIRKRAMQDPEVQDILRDPAMRMILEQMQTDRQAVQDHLKNPEIRAKIQKLIESGLIQVR